MNFNQLKTCCSKPPTTPTTDGSPHPEEEKKIQERVTTQPSVFYAFVTSCTQCLKEFFQPLPPPVKWSKLGGGNNACDPLLGEPVTSVALVTDIVLQEGTQLQQTTSECPKDETQYEEEDERSGGL